MPDFPDVHVYEVYVFDCDVCGGQTMLGDVQPDKGDIIECADCAAPGVVA